MHRQRALHCQEKIEDKSSLSKDEQGRPWTYVPHFSWVHALNADVAEDLDGSRVMCDGRPVTLMRWLGRQRARSGWESWQLVVHNK